MQASQTDRSPEHLLQLIDGREPLLHDHDEKEPGLPVAPSPQPCVHSGDRWPHDADPALDDHIASPEPAGLSDLDTRVTARLRTLGSADLDLLVHQPGDPSRLQSGNAVQCRARAGNSHRHPALGCDVERTVVQHDHLTAELLPPPALHLIADVPTRHASLHELTPRKDITVLGLLTCEQLRRTARRRRSRVCGKRRR